MKTTAKKHNIVRLLRHDPLHKKTRFNFNRKPFWIFCRNSVYLYMYEIKGTSVLTILIRISIFEYPWFISCFPFWFINTCYLSWKQTFIHQNAIHNMVQTAAASIGSVKEQLPFGIKVFFFGLKCEKEASQDLVTFSCHRLIFRHLFVAFWQRTAWDFFLPFALWYVRLHQSFQNSIFLSWLFSWSFNLNTL